MRRVPGTLRASAALVLVLATAWLSGACDRRDHRLFPLDAPERPRASDAELLREGGRFLDDPAFRRTAVAASLTNPRNVYSRQRLSSYGLQTTGWDLLPEWNPRSVVLTRAMADDLRDGKRPAVDSTEPPLWDGARPTTMAGWIRLGREVFFRYPLRREPYVEWGVLHPEAGERAGVRATGDGDYPGVVAFVDVRGQTQIGMTCAMCHADVAGGRLVVGRARRAFDYGALRLAYHAATRTFVDPDLARRMRSWGPGRADVTEDDDEDPVAIPDLWGLRDQAYLTQAGTIRHTGPAALAIRQETQLLTSNHQTVRPPRELAFALTMFLYAVAPPPVEPAPDAAAAARGRELFRRACVECHANRAGGGELVPAARVETDPALANGAARGTGNYRTPALVRVAAAAPYFHDGSVAALEDVFAPERVEPGFTRGALRPGPVAGHRYGMGLPDADRAALVAYLRTM